MQEIRRTSRSKGKATGGMVKMVSMLTTIDQVGCWDDAYNSHLFKNFSEAKKKHKAQRP